MPTLPDRQRRELEAIVGRLSAETRVAEIHALDQVVRGAMVNNRPATDDKTTIEFIELDREGHPLPGRRFVIDDRVIFFDALVIQFDQEHVAAGDALKGRSLALFRRIYGEHQEPARGFLLDESGDVPDVYRVNPEPTDFEKRLWERFWKYAEDRELAAEDGVRVAQGQAVYHAMKRGQVWSLKLQNNGGLLLELRRTATGVPDHPVVVRSEPAIEE